MALDRGIAAPHIASGPGTAMLSQSDADFRRKYWLVGLAIA